LPPDPDPPDDPEPPDDPDPPVVEPPLEPDPEVDPLPEPLPLPDDVDPVEDVAEESAGLPLPPADAVLHAPVNTTSESTARGRRHRVVSSTSNPRKARSLTKEAATPR
jgi:hypothetical protein